MVPSTVLNVPTPAVRQAVATTVRTAASPCANPHRVVAVGDLVLDDDRPQVALAGVVHRLDPAGEGGGDQELVAGAPHPVLDIAGQVAGDRDDEDAVEAARVATLLARAKAEPSHSLSRSATGSSPASSA